MRLLLAIGICLLMVCNLGAAQQGSGASQDHTKPAANDLQNAVAVQGQYRPELPLQRALKIAEDYIDKQHIDISTYWLYQAHWILYGSESQNAKDRKPAWHFLWTSNKPSLGDYVEIIVFMDGSVMRAVSM